jgi:hypothetical protein
VDSSPGNPNQRQWSALRRLCSCFVPRLRTTTWRVPGLSVSAGQKMAEVQMENGSEEARLGAELGIVQEVVDGKRIGVAGLEV